jgi:Domain of unknown function (DUF5060)/Protein of unknown function (DUF4038)/Domain of unknown function (DUF5605)
MNRREMMKLSAGALCGTGAASRTAVALAASESGNGTVEQWGVFEAVLHGPSEGSPFADVTLSATLRIGHRAVNVNGFYDGEGVYRIRFMPDQPGDWSFETDSNRPELTGKTGSFHCVNATEGNHGPVQVAHQFHFEYADKTPFFPFGTTCYSYGFMAEPYASQTLETLKTAGFNKARICLLPKPQGDHPLFALPFERDASGANDWTRLNPAYFQRVESRIRDLMTIGVQADVILFHPYDSWGYKSMPPDVDDRYLRYAVARLAAYRNVWWAIANEYDLVKSKTTADWDRFFRIVQECDPSSHLRSIHHSRVLYDHSKPWVTHASLQAYNFEKSSEYREAWGKPIVWDEIQYEGNIARRWGNLSPQEMTRRFWLAIVAGTYATHGETYMTSDGSPVWSDGGTMHGSSAPRIAFLRKLVESITTTGLAEYDNSYYLSAGKPGDLYLYYFDDHCAAEYDFPLPDGEFRCTLIDPWEMTTNELPRTLTAKRGGTDSANDGAVKPGAVRVTLPGKPFRAVLLKKV